MHMSMRSKMKELVAKDTFHKKEDLPATLLIDMDDGEHIGEVLTKHYVEKATDYFSDFYGAHITERPLKARHRNEMKETVIEQLKAVLMDKQFGHGLNAIGYWMQKDVLFPQDLSAHQCSKPFDMVEKYLHIHRVVGNK